MRYEREEIYAHCRCRYDLLKDILPNESHMVVRISYEALSGALSQYIDTMDARFAGFSTPASWIRTLCPVQWQPYTLGENGSPSEVEQSAGEVDALPSSAIEVVEEI
jgi:hypothetical protein